MAFTLPFTLRFCKPPPSHKSSYRRYSPGSVYQSQHSSHSLPFITMWKHMTHGRYRLHYPFSFLHWLESGSHQSSPTALFHQPRDKWNSKRTLAYEPEQRTPQTLLNSPSALQAFPSFQLNLLLSRSSISTCFNFFLTTSTCLLLLHQSR